MMIPMRTLPQLLQARADETPGRLSQRHKYRGIWREYNFERVRDEVRALALGLSEMGVRRGETVAIIGENEPEHFWAEFAAQALGCKVVSLYPDLTADELSYLLDDSEAVVLFAQDQEQVDKGLAIREQLPSLRAIVFWDDTGMWSYSDERLHRLEAIQELGRALHSREPARYLEFVEEGSPDDIAVLSYTSGTTGKPKGVVLTHRYLVDNVHRLIEASGAKPGIDYLTYIAPAWATEQIFGLAMGVALPMVVNFPEGPEQVLENIRELAVEAMTFAPRQWENLAATMQARMLDAGPLRRGIYEWGLRIGHAVNVSRLEGRKIPASAQFAYTLADALILRPLRDQLGLTRMKLAFCGGSMMAPDVFRLFHALGIPLRNIYGSTELGLLTCHQGERYDLETVGKWMKAHPDAGPPIEWKLGDNGELLVRGGSFFGGYFKRHDASQERVVDGWYLTGDAVTRTERDELVFLERISDLRRLRTGETFPPQFVETRLRFSPFIKDLMTVGDETRDFVAALINIDMNVVSRWAEERKIGFSTFTDLSQKSEVADLLRGEIARVNQFLPEHARVIRFANFPKELDPDEGELTRSRKLRREFLEVRYAPIIEAMYAGDSEAPVEIAVTYQDGRKGSFSARVLIHDVDPAGSARASASGQRRIA